MMTHLSRFLSGIFSPLLTPTYGVLIALWVSVLCYQPLGTRLAVLLVMFGITCMLPVIFISVLHNMKVIKDVHLIDRHERIYPYIAATACYIGGIFYLLHVNSPAWLTAFMVSGTLALFITLLINLKWKISAHSTGMGGLVAMVYFIHASGIEAFNTLWLLCLAIIIAGAVGTARLYLERHTLWQILAGFFNGYICVTLISSIFT